MLMVLASFLFATMSLCVKLASAYYGNGAIVTFRGLIGAVVMLAIVQWRGRSLRTPVPGLHLKRGLAGVTALSLWFHSISGLPLATAVTLNYMSSIWMAVFMIAGAVWFGRSRVDARLVWTVLVGFVGVAAILRPSLERDQWWFGAIGLVSGVLSAAAYLQVKSLGQAGEPEDRVVFYFSLCTAVVGALQFLLVPVREPVVPLRPAGWVGPMLLLGVGVSATVAQLAMTRAYARGRTLVNASLQYFGIAFSFVFGVWLFDDPVRWSSVLGMGLVVGAGIVASRLSGSARARHNPAQPSKQPLDPV